MNRILSHDVFEGHDKLYKFASVVKGKAYIMTHAPIMKKCSNGEEYLSYPADTYVKLLEGNFENTNLIIERIGDNR